MFDREAIRIIGIDPGLQRTGWGIVDVSGSRLAFVASGVLTSHAGAALATRLGALHDGLTEVIRSHAPGEAAIEETFVNRDPRSALKLGQARGIALVVPALAGLGVFEYAANLVKKTVTGSGHADKVQVITMVRILLPRSDPASADAADALAVAIAHAQLRRAPSAPTARSATRLLGPRAAEAMPEK
jgi:crossover junction endodeoxyribonuclease RuvC